MLNILPKCVNIVDYSGGYETRKKIVVKMGCCICAVVTYAFYVLIAFVIYKIYEAFFKSFPIPKLDTTKNWGKGQELNSDPKTFHIRATEAQLKKLKEQLLETDFLREPLEDSNFVYGTNPNALIDIVKYWRETYLAKWQEREEYLNKFPQYLTKVQGLDVHYIHAKPEKSNKKVIPLLIQHGWPGSIREFYEIIPKLIDTNNDTDFVFEAKTPSLAGFGWSEATTKKDFILLEYATVLRNLMIQLGHKQFLVQGGDWGSIVGNYLTTLYPENVIGYHSNMCTINTPMAYIKCYIMLLLHSVHRISYNQAVRISTSHLLQRLWT